MNSERWGWMNRTPWRRLWMNSERCWGGLDEQFLVGVDEQDPVVLPLDEQDPDRSSRLGLDEQDPVEGWMNRTTPWRAG